MFINEKVGDLFVDFLNLVFPDLCRACGLSLYKGESLICHKCWHHLPFTQFHLEKENSLKKSFYGRLPLEYALSCFVFKKGGKVQNILHHLKYKGDKDLGRLVGEEYGKIIQESFLSESESPVGIDFLVPIPLHPKKLSQRGYNQSMHFALGLQEVMEVMIAEKLLIRKKNNATQTQKGRLDRFDKMDDVFELNEAMAKGFENCHLALVDDVLTTGSTLEACGRKLLSIPGVKLSIITIAAAP